MGTRAKIVVKRKPGPVKRRWDGRSVEQSQVWAYQVPGEGKMYDSLEALEKSGLYKNRSPPPPPVSDDLSFLHSRSQWWSNLEEEEAISTITLGSCKPNPRAHADTLQLFPHSDLPALVEDNIFARLPLSSLMTSKAVSCAWESKVSTLPATALDAHTLVFTLFSKSRLPDSFLDSSSQVIFSNRQQIALGSPMRLALWSEPGTQSQSQKMSLSLLPPGDRCSCPKGYTLACVNGSVFVFVSTPNYLVGNPVTGQYLKVGARRALNLGKEHKRLALLLSSSEPLVFKLVCLEFHADGVEVHIYDSLTDTWQPLDGPETSLQVLASAWDRDEKAWYWLAGDYYHDTGYLHGYRVEDNRATRWMIRGVAGLGPWRGYDRHLCCLVRSKGRLLFVCEELRGDDFVIQMWGFRPLQSHHQPKAEVVLESEEVVESGGQHFVSVGVELRCCSDGDDRVWVLLPGLREVDDLLLRYEMSSKSWKRYQLSGCRLGDGGVAGIEGMAFTGEPKLTESTGQLVWTL